MKRFIYLSVATVIFLLPDSLEKLIPSMGASEFWFIYTLMSMFVFLVALFASLISIVLIVNKLLKKKTPSLNHYIFPAILLIMMLNTFALRLFPIKLPTGSDVMKFDSVQWLSKDDTAFASRLRLRQKMLKDLVENVLPGKSKKEIEALLGKSLVTNYFKSVDKDLIYYLGNERDSFISIDSEWLLIWLDQEGKFKKYEIYND